MELFIQEKMSEIQKTLEGAKQVMTNLIAHKQKQLAIGGQPGDRLTLIEQIENYEKLSSKVQETLREVNEIASKVFEQPNQLEVKAGR